MAQCAKVVSLDRVRAGREALRGAFPMGPTRNRLLAALEWSHDHVLLNADHFAQEFGTDRPIKHLLQALGGGWSARPDLYDCSSQRLTPQEHGGSLNRS